MLIREIITRTWREIKLTVRISYLEISAQSFTDLIKFFNEGLVVKSFKF